MHVGINYKEFIIIIIGMNYDSGEGLTSLWQNRKGLEQEEESSLPCGVRGIETNPSG